MGKLIKNPFGSGYVVYAEDRAHRPHINADDTTHCPFCVDNRAMMRHIIIERGNVAVCPNLYPALSPDDGGDFGIHEVLVDTPDHFAKIYQLSVSDIANTLDVIRERVGALSSIDGVRHVQVFKNDGSRAGASIAHSHWQIVAVGYVPDGVVVDVSAQEHVICEDENVALFCPNASAFPYETWIAPKRRVGLSDINGNETISIAKALKAAFTALYGIIKDLSYNIIFCNTQDGHLFIRIVPRNAGLGGFELSGCGNINAVLPKKAAETLRTCL